jgi:oxygen-independent coproporphyrinogen-3 oxidase
MGPDGLIANRDRSSLEATEPALGGGIYVHFPYCRHRCHYCDFSLTTPREIPQEAYTQAVLSELRHRSGALSGPARSLYFGGGTPSLWSPGHVQAVIEAAGEHHGLETEAEITLEANPEDLDLELATAFVSAGINRFSLGLQSLGDERLSLLDRQHDGARARASVGWALQAGARSVSADLIFGTPGQTEDSWRSELEDALGLNLDHLSVYGLTIEPRTRLERLIADGDYGATDEDAHARLFGVTREVLTGAGYVHYEVSSYARPGREAIHNRAYWHGRPYLGVGAAAHGLLHRRRWVNIRRPEAYMDAALMGSAESESEILSPEIWAWERVLTGLRDLELGVSSQWLTSLGAEIAPLLSSGRLERVGDRVRVTREHVPFLDSVLLELAP